eukprot:5116509-Prymnesium_polylepis.1
MTGSAACSAACCTACCIRPARTRSAAPTNGCVDAERRPSLPPPRHSAGLAALGCGGKPLAGRPTGTEP